MGFESDFDVPVLQSTGEAGAPVAHPARQTERQGLPTPFLGWAEQATDDRKRIQTHIERACWRTPRGRRDWPAD